MIKDSTVNRQTERKIVKLGRKKDRHKVREEKHFDPVGCFFCFKIVLILNRKDLVRQACK